MRALQAIASAGSFHAAAARLGYTQSAISQQIAGLERAVAQRLVERSGGRPRVTLTEPGERLLRHAEAIFARLDVAVRELGALGDGMSGSVRIGYFQSVGQHLLPGLIKSVRQRSGALELHLHECDCNLELERQVAWGELDLAFVVLPVSQDFLDSTALLRDLPVAVVSPDDPLAGRAAITLDELAGRDLATFGLSPFQASVEDALAARGRRARVVVRSQDNDALLALASGGDATALMTQLSARGAAAAGLHALPVLGAPSRRIGVAWDARGSRSPAATVVIDEAARLCAEIDVAERLPADQHGLSAMPIVT